MLIEELNKALNQAFGEMLGQTTESARYRYIQDKKKNRYFHTVEKINHKGNQRYVAGIYRYYKTKDNWKLVKKVGFAKKYKAIKWAADQYNKTV